MTDVKQLPENIEQLEQLTEFKRVYKKYTVDQLEDLLTEAEVGYLSADNKADLVWRLLDHQGFNFEAATVEPEAIDQQTTPNTDDEADANENVQTVQDDANGTNGDQLAGEGTTDPSADSASTDDGVQPDEVVSVANNDAPSDIGNSDDASANEAEQPAEASDQSATNAAAPSDEAALTQTVTQDVPADESTKRNLRRHNRFRPERTPANEPKADYVEVLNTGAFSFLETATSTLVPAKQRTKIYPTATVDKEQITRNIKQYNHTRGNKLRVLN